MDAVNIFITQGKTYTKPIEYILTILAINKSIEIKFVDQRLNADLFISDSDDADIIVSSRFYEQLLNKKEYSHSVFFKDDNFIRNHKNEIDHLSTAFYMINSFQEYGTEKNSYDNFGRYKYEASYQKRFNSVTDNIVQTCFDVLCKEKNGFFKVKTSSRKTSFFISHDIDSLYGSFLEDGLYAIKKGRIDILLKLLFNEAIMEPGWFNIDKIMKLNSEYDVRSTFFWIVNKRVGENGVKNADYNLNRIAKVIDSVNDKGFVNGLHKSSTKESLNEELNKLPFKTQYNRYHFLKFKIPESWNKIENSNIKFDASLGFAEMYGFRNSYGSPFQPYDIQNNKPFSFLEVPLNIMDTTFHRYLKAPKNTIAKLVIDFIEKNKDNCVLSLLWHNNYFTDYKYGGYLAEYKKILAYVVENKFQAILPDDIIKRYKR